MKKSDWPSISFLFQNDGSYLFSLVLQFLSMELCQRTVFRSEVRRTGMEPHPSFAGAKVQLFRKPPK